MTSSILRLSSKYIMQILVMFSLFILLRGHNAPGGGFIGGLLASSGFIVYAIANGVEKGYRALPLSSRTLMIMGLIFLLFSASIGLVIGEVLLKGLWIQIDLTWFYLKLGTPLLFDIGIYCIVTGGMLTVTYTLMKELQWK